MLVVYAEWIKNASKLKTVGGMDNTVFLVYLATSKSGKSVHTSNFLEDLL